jgi:hypothetical protein
MAIYRQRIGKHAVELLKVVFSAGSAPRLYNEDSRSGEGIIERELMVGCSVELCKED